MQAFARNCRNQCSDVKGEAQAAQTVRRESHVRICERLGVRLPGPTRQLVGDFKNNGRELRRKGNPEPVRVHDFKLPERQTSYHHGRLRRQQWAAGKAMEA